MIFIVCFLEKKIKFWEKGRGGKKITFWEKGRGKNMVFWAIYAPLNLIPLFMKSTLCFLIKYIFQVYRSYGRFLVV